MGTLSNFDLLTVGIVVAAMVALGFTVYFSNLGSITARAFLVFTLVTSVWGIVNYLNYQFASPTITLWLLRFVMFFAVWQAYTLFHLFYVFPESRIKIPAWHTFILLPLAALVSIITLTPAVFPSIAQLSSPGQVSSTVVNPGIYLF